MIFSVLNFFWNFGYSCSTLLWYRCYSPHWSRDALSPISWIFFYLFTLFFTQKLFKASALWADAFYKLKCPSVCLSVRPCVCSLLGYRLNVFLPPLPKVGCSIYLEIQNPWGKIMKRSGLRFEDFC